MRLHRTIPVVSFTVLFAVSAGAQRPTGTPMPHYDTATVQSFSGRVLEVRSPAPAARGTAGVQLLVEAGIDTLPVHLGPSWVLQQQGIAFAAGDVIHVIGSRVTIAGAPAVVAAEVRKDDRILRLREPSGAPRWGPRGRGPAMR